MIFFPRGRFRLPALVVSNSILSPIRRNFDASVFESQKKYISHPFPSWLGYLKILKIHFLWEMASPAFHGPSLPTPTLNLICTLLQAEAAQTSSSGQTFRFYTLEENQWYLFSFLVFTSFTWAWKEVIKHLKCTWKMKEKEAVCFH